MAQPSRESRPAPKSTKEKRDDDIMMTNDSSIVSKQSVVKLYYNTQPDFFKPFVAKSLRRSPLINRGYWLRMRAIEHTVVKFLKESPEKDKLVINLGCGYDPLPFHFLHHEPELCSRATFVDVDYPQLMAKKRACIANSATLQELLPVLASGTPKANDVWRAGQYVTVGCDLRKLKELETVLQDEVHVHDCAILFIAEVSIAYMDFDSADAVVAWASSFKDARFCILEQCLPDGPSHPFAWTMLRHFAKLHTNLKVCYQYPTLESQENRFLKFGWGQAKAKTLWELWGDDEYVIADERKELDAVEPFDEWEELALLGSHYLLLVARTDTAQPAQDQPREDRHYEKVEVALEPGPSNEEETSYRRYGAMFSDGQKAIFHGGYGEQSRRSDCDVYSSDAAYKGKLESQLENAGALMCHTVTSVSPDGDLFLLAGGRQSPAKAIANTWLVTSKGQYESVNSFNDSNIFQARYRHSAVPISVNGEKDAPGVLIYGGKSSATTVLGDFILFDLKKRTWLRVPCSSAPENRPGPPPRFGASMCEAKNLDGSQSGILMGGISKNGTILEDVWEWTLVWQDGSPRIICRDKVVESNGSIQSLPYARFGAQLLPTVGQSFLLIGGVTKDRILQWKEEILLLLPSVSTAFKHVQMSHCPSPRPLFIGLGAAQVQDKTILAGGGAVCFSMGCYWNTNSYSLQVKHTGDELEDTAASEAAER